MRESLLMCMILLLLNGCSRVPKLTAQNCSKEAVLEYAMKEFRKHGYTDKYHKFEFKEDSVYRLTYTLRNPSDWGGGAYMIFSKDSCKLIDRKFYQ